VEGTWRLPPNYQSIHIVEGSLSPHRYRVSYTGQDPLVQVHWDTGSSGLLTGTTIDVTALWIKIVPNGGPRPHPLAGEYMSLD
jgi:hypothetical protein